MRWLLLAALFAGGCDDDCVAGVCPSFDETRRFPGPCRSAKHFEGECQIGYPSSTGSEHCEYDDLYGFAYDDAGRLTEVTSGRGEFTVDARGYFAPVEYTQTTFWRYDEAGEVSSIDEAAGDGEPIELWRFEATQVLNRGTVYDRASFAFLPFAGVGVATPRAELGLVRTATEEFSWERLDEAHLVRCHGTGCRWRDEFTLDERGRIVLLVTPQNDLTQTWQFDGDRLVGFGTREKLRYDRGGNLVDDTYGLDTPRVYDYACWQ